MLKAAKVISTINKGIALNPTTINLCVKERKVVDGAIENVTSSREITVVIYFENDSRKEKHKIDKDITYLSDKMKMIADKDAGIITGPDKHYTFVHPVSGEKYRIFASYPYIVENTICGYDCDLMREN